MKEGTKLALWVAGATVMALLAGLVLTGALAIVDAFGVGGVFWSVVLLITIYKILFPKRAP